MADTGDEAVEMDEVEDGSDTEVQTGALGVDETGTGTGVLELEDSQGCGQFRATRPGCLQRRYRPEKGQSRGRDRILDK